MKERMYEAILIVHPELGEKEIVKLETQFGEIIGRLGGRVVEKQNLGKRRLSYKVKKLSDALTLQIRFEAPSGAPAQVIKAVKLLETVARIMIVAGPLPDLARSRGLGNEEGSAEGHDGESQ